MTVSRNDFNRLVWLLIGAGVVVRLVLAFTTTGQAYDLQSYALVDEALRHHVFGVYHQLDNFNVPPYGRWPYPPGFFLVIVPLARLAHLVGLTFTSLIRVPAILCDAGIAWLVQDHLRRRGFGEQSRLLAVALVAFGPSFLITSGYHGQLDSVAFLPCVGAAIVWCRSTSSLRPYAAGALIGVGAAIKTVPILMLVALLPTARSWREALKLIAPAIMIPLAAFAPWLIFDGPGKSLVWRYRGGPGLGGISLAVKPSLPLAAFNVTHESLGGLVKTVYDDARWITGAALAAVALLLLRARRPPVESAVLLWLAVWAFGVTFFLQYMVWGLPFLLMAGYLRQVLLIEVTLIGPTIITYASGLRAWYVWVFYTVPMLVFWLVLVAWTLLIAGRMLAADRGVQATV